MSIASQITIIPEDWFIRVDGDIRICADALFDETIHAIQWNGTAGEIEYADQNTPNKHFFADEYAAILQPYVDIHDAQKATDEAAEEKAKKEAEEFYHSEARRWIRLRNGRDSRLSASDYVMTIDYYAKLSDAQKAAWAEYRQALRDLPDQEGAPWDDDTVPWPTKPE